MHLKAYFIALLFLSCNCSCSTRRRYTASNATTAQRIPCEEEPTSRGIGLSLVLIVIILVGISGNVTVIAGILYTASLRRQVTNHFVISLAVADVLIPSTVLPFRVMIELKNGDFCLSEHVCKAAVALSAFLDIASITNILMISIDRFTAVTLPLSYTRVMSEQRARLLIAGVWIYAALWSSLGFFDWNYPHDETVKISKTNVFRCHNDNKYYFIVVFSAVFIVPLIVIGIMYLFILREALKHVRAIGALEVEINDTSKKTMRRKRSKHLRSMKSVSVVYGAFLICWLPNCIITIHSYTNSRWWTNFKLKHATFFYVLYYTFAQILPPLNCTLNPFIYTLLHGHFRTAFKAAYLRMVGRRMSRRYTETSIKRSYELQSTRRGTTSPANENNQQNSKKEGKF